MKTLKTITLSFLFVAFATIAMAHSTANSYIRTNDDLRQLIKEKVGSDLTNPSNYLNENEVIRFEENVEVIFFITPNKTISIKSVNSQSRIASEYIKQLLNKQKLNVDDLFTGKVFSINIKLNYKAS
jgi:hypothetical protein